MELKLELEQLLGGPIAKAENEALYNALLTLTRQRLEQAPRLTGDRKLYYISAEFLIGKLLSNNLINLRLFDEVQALLAENGKDLAEIEEIENEPSLGNGGLGRLAACYLDSAATLGLPADGVGLLYHFGLFRQTFHQLRQWESPDRWLTDHNWLRDTGTVFEVPFPQGKLRAHLYDIDVSGYENGVNKLHLFDLETVDESLVRDGISFDQKDVARNLTLFLYPDDSDRYGRLLRVYQQYFMVSAGAQLILKELSAQGYALRDLHKHAVIQINDTHPSMVIPELIRLLTADGISMDEAISIVRQTCAYTNHTILAEALEKWPLEYLREAVPQLVPIIEELDRRVKASCDDPKVAIIDQQDRVHMAHIDIHYGFSVNGVAALHTEILKTSELKAFADLYPEKFNNKTNGVTFRRWLMHADPELARFITELIGPGWKKNAMELEKLLEYRDNEEVLSCLVDVKHQKKKEFAAYLQEKMGVEVDTHSVFDVQSKRLHEYKRQQMNCLYIIWKYLQIKSGRQHPTRPVTLIFGAKAAPAYTIAKDIIHLILALSAYIEKDPDVSPWLKVVMVENYNVTWAEKLIPACDISEQISLASKEASGTGNMKFMLNGAVTLGTLDGANVEISQLVGEENIAIFGKTSDEVIHLYEEGPDRYTPKAFYPEDPEITELLDFMVRLDFLRFGSPENLGRLWGDMTRKDWFMALLDVKDYIAAKERLLARYEDRTAWARMMLVNIAKAGFFSSDRCIEEYNRDIWHLR